MKVGFIFPGQGSQYPGMGYDFFEKYSQAREVFEKADSILDFNLSEICFSGNPECLQKTEIAQPAILTVSTAICSVLNEKNIKAELLAGHSLGEYSALVYGGVLTFESALKLVKIRGNLMAKAGETFPGTMVAVIGAEKKELERECLNFSDSDSVVIANYNAPSQFVISGTLEGIESFSKILKEKGKRIVPLNVSGAFHSHLMKPALDELIEAIDETHFSDANIPIITNIDSKITFEGRRFKEKLKWQLISPVLWEDCIKCMISQRVDTFLEAGPLKVLSKLVRRIDNTKNSFSIEDSISLDNFISFHND